MSSCVESLVSVEPCCAQDFPACLQLRCYRKHTNLNASLFDVKDANIIKKVFIQRKTEIDHAEPTKTSVRIKNRRSAQGDRFSAITLALQYGSENDEDALLSGEFVNTTNARTH